MESTFSVAGARIDTHPEHIHWFLSYSPSFTVSGCRGRVVDVEISQANGATTREEGLQGAARAQGQAIALYALGRQEEHEAKLNELIERWGDQWPSEVAYVYAYMGDTDRAFEWLQRSVDEEKEGEFRPAGPLLKPLHNDPRWLLFLESIGRSPEQLAATKFEVTLPGQ